MNNKIKWLHDIMVALNNLDKSNADEEMMALYWDMRNVISKWVAIPDYKI